MELGEFVFLAKGFLESVCPATTELDLQIKAQSKKTNLQLLWRAQDGTPSQVLAVVDRQLTNRDMQLPQNRRGVPNPAGQILSIVAAELADLQVVSVSATSAGVLAVRVIVRLLPAAFDVMVPEQTSRAIAMLDKDAAAAAAAASLVGALMNVVEILAKEDPEALKDAVAAADDDEGDKEEGVLAAAEKSGGEDAGAQDDAFPADSYHHHKGQTQHQQPSYSDVRDEIFDIVAPRDWHIAHPDPPGLKSKLFPYQQRALSWMIWRETQPELGGGRDVREDQQVAEAAAATAEAAAAAAAGVHLGDFASQDLFWRRMELYGGQELWVNPYPGGGLRREPPPPPPRQLVGILADEMGLGKTVEVIALMLARPPPRPLPQRADAGDGNDGDGDAATATAAAAAAAAATAVEALDQGGGKGGGRPWGPTLIVTPPSILQQWSHEIANHSNLKVFVYDGLRWHRQQSAEKEKERIKEAKREQRLAAQREKEARRQERARQREERAAARAEAQRVRSERKRARLHEVATRDGLPDYDRHVKRRRARGDSGHRRGDADAKLSINMEGSDETGDDYDDHDVGDRRDDDGGKTAAAAAAAAVVVAVVDGGHDGPGTGPSTSGGCGGGHMEWAPQPAAAERPVGTRASRRATRRQRSYAAMQNGNNSTDSGGDKDYQTPDGSTAAAAASRAAVAATGGALSREGNGALAQGSQAGARVPGEGGDGTARTKVRLETRPASAAAPPTGAGRVPSRMKLYHEELMAALYAGTPLCPASCDPTAEAAEAVRELLAADVVLTTYTVLKEEVHYSPSNRVLAGLRHEKKYSVPESPLLQIRWHRLVMDEAQMVGGSYSYVVQMASRIEAIHRWCVTGTPIGAGGLDDILGLLCVLKYTPYDDAAVFKRLVSDPYRSGTVQGHTRLALLLKPIMWRSSKAVAAQDHPLPRRVLQEAHLRFSAAEQTFYDVILGETRKAFDEMTNHRRQEEEMRQQQQQQEGTALHGSVVIDLTTAGNGGVIDQQINRNSRDTSEDNNSNKNSDINRTNHSLMISPRQPPTPGSSMMHHHHGQGYGKRRRCQDRGEALAQVASAELHQLRLACVHVQLTRYWQKLGQELALHGHGHGGHHGQPGLGVSPPGIDEVMARLRDQAQLHLQNAERDLCMALNALALRLESTARKVKTMAARRAAREAASKSTSACGGGGGTAPAADGVADEDDDDEEESSEEQEEVTLREKGRNDDSKTARKKTKKTKITGQQQGTAAAKSAAKFMTANSVGVSSGIGDAAAAAAGAGGGGGGSGEAENTVSAFRYSGRGMKAVVLLADAERMLRECRELLECSWNVGENGIEAAAAAAAAAGAGSGDGGGGGGEGLDQEIKAAAASIRSWRFVQAHTSQLLADLLSAHPQVYGTEANGAAAGGAAGGGGGGGPSIASAADAADAATAASLRAAELRAYVASRVTDVRATADRELQRARERLERVNATIARLQAQLVEEYDIATSRGLPAGVVPEPRSWLADVQARLEAARQVEAERRAARQAAAAAHATLALMGKEVGELLNSEETAVMRQRMGLEAAAGSLLVAAAVERLNAANGGLRHLQAHRRAAAAAGGQPLEGGLEWRSVLVGGVTLLLPPEGTTAAGVARDPYLAAAAEWCLSYPPAVGLLRRAVKDAVDVAAAEQAGQGVAHGFDLMTVLLCERHLRNPIRMLESRLQEQRKTAMEKNTAGLLHHGLEMLLPALEAVRLRIELLRAWKDQNTAELLVEVAQDGCEAVTAEVMAAAQGQVAGMASLLRLSEEELRSQVAQLKSRCGDLRHKKAFFQNQYLEASRLRCGGGGAATAAAAAVEPAAERHVLTRALTPQPRPTDTAAAIVQQDSGSGAVATAATVDKGSASDVAAGGTIVPQQRRHDTAAVAAAAADSAAAAACTANVGVACCTGILACLQPWEQWRLVRQRQQPQQQQSRGTLSSGGQFRDGSNVQQYQQQGQQQLEVMVVDLTVNADQIGVDTDALPAGASTADDPRVIGHNRSMESSGGGGGGDGDESAAAIRTAMSAEDAAAAAAAATGEEGMAAAAAAAAGVLQQQQQQQQQAMQTEGGCVPPPISGGAGGGGVVADHAIVTSSPATGPIRTDPRAAAAAAAARASLAAAAAAARARFGLGLGAVGGKGLDSGAGGVVKEEEKEEETENGALTCAVCGEPLMADIRVLPCGHYYCGSCCSVILGPNGDRRCPTCRMDVRDKDLVVKVAAVSTAAGSGGGGGAAAAAVARLRLVGGEADPPEGPELLCTKIDGGSELMCKISALMRRLVWLRNHRPAEKSLVFSQWPDALQIVQRGLRTNGIGCVALETGRKMRAAMSAFFNDDSCRVFLLSLRQGAAGLTLVRANHVFLLEPSLDPAIEQQAVARVHRIGQTRDVTVTRLLVDGTVEEAVMRMLKEKQQLFVEAAGSGGGGGPSTSGPSSRRGRPAAGHTLGGGGGGGLGMGPMLLAPGAMPLLEGGDEGEEASLPCAAPRQEVLGGEDMSYLLHAVLQ